MYANIGKQPGMQLGGGKNKVGAAKPKASGELSRTPLKAQPLQSLEPHVYYELTTLSKEKEYKEGGASVKSKIFNGAHDRMKALTFLQQFDAAYVGHFIEASKIRKATTFFKGNAL